MKYIWLSLIIVLFTACNSKVKQANKRGLEYIKQNMYDQAITEFNNALMVNNEWFPTYYNRAIAYANTRRYKEALNDFNYIVGHFPDHAESFFNRGIVYENLGVYPQAIQDYTETIKLKPDFIMAYHYRGIVRFRMNDFDGALADYNQALELGKGVSMDVAKAKEFGLNSSALHFNRGVVMQKKGDVEAAIKDYSSAIAIDPSSAKSYYNRAIAQMSLNRTGEARKDLDIASKLGYSKAEEVKNKYFGN